MISKYHLYSFLFILSLLIACKQNTTTNTADENNLPVNLEYQLVKVWESDTVFTTCESVIYDPVTNQIFVSNIEGEPWADDGKGSIGLLSMDGTTINPKWITGLNAPKGMGISNGYLYVTDNQRLVEIDIASSEIESYYALPNVGGLNDITTGPDGTVYFTDRQKGAVHMLKDGVITKVTDGLNGANGIFYEEGRLLIGVWNDETLSYFDLNENKMVVMADSLFQPDGIEAVGDGGYLVSSWSGLIHYVDIAGQTDLLLDSKKDGISSADIDFLPEQNILLVPTFYNNTVVAYRLERKI